MMVFVLCLVVTGIVFLLCYAAWWWGSTHPKKVDPKVEADMTLQRNKERIVEAIYKGAKLKRKLIPGSESLKISIIEKLNISPEQMRDCLKALIKEMIIIESADAVALTSFGVQTYEVYIKKRK